MKQIEMKITQSMGTITLVTESGQEFSFWKRRGREVLRALGLPATAFGEYTISEKRWDHLARNSFRV